MQEIHIFLFILGYNHRTYDLISAMTHIFPPLVPERKWNYGTQRWRRCQVDQSEFYTKAGIHVTMSIEKKGARISSKSVEKKRENLVDR